MRPIIIYMNSFVFLQNFWFLYFFTISKSQSQFSLQLTFQFLTSPSSLPGFSKHLRMFEISFKLTDVLSTGETYVWFIKIKKLRNLDTPEKSLRNCLSNFEPNMNSDV